MKDGSVKIVRTCVFECVLDCKIKEISFLYCVKSANAFVNGIFSACAGHCIFERTADDRRLKEIIDVLCPVFCGNSCILSIIE